MSDPKTLRELVGGPNDDGKCSVECGFHNPHGGNLGQEKCDLNGRFTSASGRNGPPTLCMSIFSFAALGDSGLQKTMAAISPTEFETRVSGVVSNPATDTWGGAGPDCPTERLEAADEIKRSEKEND